MKIEYLGCWEEMQDYKKWTSKTACNYLQILSRWREQMRPNSMAHLYHCREIFVQLGLEGSFISSKTRSWRRRGKKRGKKRTRFMRCTDGFSMNRDWASSAKCKTRRRRMKYKAKDIWRQRKEKIALFQNGMERRTWFWLVGYGSTVAPSG